MAAEKKRLGNKGQETSAERKGEVPAVGRPLSSSPPVPSQPPEGKTERERRKERKETKGENGYLKEREGSDLEIQSEDLLSDEIFSPDLCGALAETKRKEKKTREEERKAEETTRKNEKKRKERLTRLSEKKKEKREKGRKVSEENGVSLSWRYCYTSFGEAFLRCMYSRGGERKTDEKRKTGSVSLLGSLETSSFDFYSQQPRHVSGRILSCRAPQRATESQHSDVLYPRDRRTDRQRDRRHEGGEREEERRTRKKKNPKKRREKSLEFTFSIGRAGSKQSDAASLCVHRRSERQREEEGKQEETQPGHPRRCGETWR